MFCHSFFAALPAVVLLNLRSTLALPSGILGERATGPLDSFLTSEVPIALGGILANIGSGGVNDQGAGPGIVIASPSTSNPDCKLCLE